LTRHINNKELNLIIIIYEYICLVDRLRIYSRGGGPLRIPVGASTVLAGGFLVSLSSSKLQDITPNECTNVSSNHRTTWQTEDTVKRTITKGMLLFLMQNHVWVSKEGAVASRLSSLTAQKILAIIHTLATAHSTTSVYSVTHCSSHVQEDLCTGEKNFCTGGLVFFFLLQFYCY
jgi:hypothetical protein